MNGRSDSALPSLGLYVHLPWCVRKCPYCDFNSHQAPASLPENEYVKALVTELEYWRSQIGDRSITSIFFGGGTPSLFSADNIAHFLDQCRQRLALTADVEITLEANPGTADAQNFAGFQQAGVNRLSIGVQSFNDYHLKTLGRIHDRSEALQAYSLARQAGFNNINIDLMFALPDQTLAQAQNDVQQALALDPTHISHYQLTIEPNTLFYADPPTLPDQDLQQSIQAHCQNLLFARGYSQYEVSAYARDNEVCRHNVNYWQFGDYLGIGAGAHSKLTDLNHNGFVIKRYQNFRHPTRYLDAVNHHGVGIEIERKLGVDDLIFEYMLNALRLRRDISAKQFSKRTGLPPEQLTERMPVAVEAGLIKMVKNACWRCTDLGWRFLNDLQAMFLPGDDTLTTNQLNYAQHQNMSDG